MTALISRFQPEPLDFDVMYDAYGNRIYRFCRHLCGNAADAEDLAQETFLAAYQSLDRFEGRSSVATWLYRIALYRWGKMKRSAPPQALPYEEDLHGLSVDPTGSRLDRLTVERALQDLPDILHETFLLVRVEGLKVREAAEVLGIPPGTVKSRLHEATGKLRAALTGETEARPPKLLRQDIRREGDVR